MDLNQLEIKLYAVNRLKAELSRSVKEFDKIREVAREAEKARDDLYRELLEARREAYSVAKEMIFDNNTEL
jgi:hypothetical protein